MNDFFRSGLIIIYPAQKSNNQLKKTPKDNKKKKLNKKISKSFEDILKREMGL